MFLVFRLAYVVIYTRQMYHACCVFTSIFQFGCVFCLIPVKIKTRASVCEKTIDNLQTSVKMQ